VAEGVGTTKKSRRSERGGGDKSNSTKILLVICGWYSYNFDYVAMKSYTNDN
jgi:hypothetical protein